MTNQFESKSPDGKEEIVPEKKVNTLELVSPLEGLSLPEKLGLKDHLRKIVEIQPSIVRMNLKNVQQMVDLLFAVQGELAKIDPATNIDEVIRVLDEDQDIADYLKEIAEDKKNS